LCTGIVLAAGLLVGTGELSPALSLNLPLETPTVKVETPTVPVKTPTVTVPSVPVKTPTVPVKTPTVPVKTPTVPVKVPTVPVKTTPVKVPTVPVKTTTVKAPTVPVKTPTVPVKTPSVPAKTPGVNVTTPVGSVKAGSSGGPSVSLKAGSASGGRSSSTAARGTTAPTSSPAGSPGAPSSGSGTPSSPLGGYAPGPGYGELPPIEGAPKGHARARIARRERRLKAIVARFRGCLDALPSSQRNLLELRTGYGAGKPLSPQAAAARLRLGAAQVARLERRALHELTDAANTRDCGQTAAVIDGVMTFIGANLGGIGPQATGGVEAVRYESTPAKSGDRASSSIVGGILGANISPTASDVILVLALLMALGALVALVLADAAGQGPRHEQWRQRMVNRLRALR
jgi:hypothetical protein